MQRRRDIAASPVRSAHEAWGVMTELVVATLDRSPHLVGSSVRDELGRADIAAIALIAGGHLSREPMTLVAADLRLDMYAIEGRDAFNAYENENLNPVPGAATATEWTLYLPCPDLLSSLVLEVIDGVGDVEAGPPPADTVESKRSGTSIDLRRLDPRART